MKLIPISLPPQTVSLGEKEIFLRFQADRRHPDWVVLHSLDLAEHVRLQRSEADFVVLIPGHGIVVVEVKGHALVRRDAHTGQWCLGQDPPRSRSPFRQASDAMFAVRERLVRHHHRLGALQFESVVVFPFADFRVDHDSSEWHHWQVVDRQELNARPLADCLVHALHCAQRDAVERRGRALPRSMSAEDCEEARSVLRPQIGEAPLDRTRTQRREEELAQWTGDLTTLLDAVWSNDRLLLRGGPGTGKTGLLIEAARRAFLEDGSPPLVLCFNRLLATSLQGALGECAQVSTLNALVSQLDFAAGARGLAARRASGEFRPAQTLIIDEAQDVMHPDACEVLNLCVEGGLQAGRVLAALDVDHQNLRCEATSLSTQTLLSSYVSVDLWNNRRNLPRISATAELYSGFRPWRHTLRADDGVRARTHYGARLDMIRILGETLTALHSEGFGPQDIVILSGCRPPDSLAASPEIQELRLIPYDVPSTNQVRYTSIHAFKGLEAPAVILTDLPHGPDPQRLMLVGLTRSTARVHLLVDRPEPFRQQYLRSAT
ncbi:NERD domain-containing protein [Deinococcus soli (ex Cha et al. 2016)]|uniref:DNA replication protein DnaC n=2 Tax=Deinococcus soli (ex Cha et al. 2016) TaxID=1309411 RepID=A0ACC6KMM0_9DEIO|nr:NERD domain-containing protein [Deinococcus soli (ex Cha et al. 2016)]MDR6220963.1 DNA replication protein DnaC [Deinococcus soli (ex Cha et al. 2016)]MDR6330957.1 DNA replication protein DnaC [Deinococcus soli (ex Cha et al. 2016)]MDR6753686.1 DNA replication protein DnaC [Deinococcus soli (ex Cha et al. 2016)]